MIERKEKPITLDRPAVPVESRATLSPEVLTIARALQTRLALLNQNQPKPRPRGIGETQAAPEAPQKKEITMKVALCGSPNDPLFTAWVAAMKDRAGDATFGETETDGTLTFPGPETVRINWGNSNLVVEPRSMRHLALTPQTILDMDTVQGITSETGNWVTTMRYLLETWDFSLQKVTIPPMRRASSQPESAVNEASL